jgi:hypothetical protein
VPERSGFGTSLLKAIFANARFDYAVEGLVCEIEVLLEDNKPGTMRAAERLWLVQSARDSGDYS